MVEAATERTAFGASVSINRTAGTTIHRAHNRVPGLRPSADLCRPPSHGNDLYENNRKIARDFSQRFLVPVTAALEMSLTTEIGERSPILETLQLVVQFSASTFQHLQSLLH